MFIIRNYSTNNLKLNIMSLDDFFRINLPYGLKRNPDDTWFAFNREYVPIGWNSKEKHESIYIPYAFKEFPIHTKYKGLTENKILKIVGNADAIHRDNDGEIVTVHLYNSVTDPISSPENWKRYSQIIMSLSKLVIKE